MSDVRRILLTGGRAPATLDLARRLAEGGAQVHLAESLGSTISSFSAAIDQTHRVPPPRQQPDAFVAALRQIVHSHGIHLVVPTCEEVFWVARAPDLPALLESRERLHEVHHKQRFVAWAQRLGLAVPPTRLAIDEAQLRAAITELGGPDAVVVKPAYSRFGTQAHVRPSPAVLAAIQPSADVPWVAQAFVDGPVVCTWSVAHKGRLTVHTAYRSRFTAGPGSAVHFAWLDDPAVLAWVRAFAEGTGWTGQLAFDLVMSADGPVAIECNPRLTSGVHLLRDGPSLLRALLDRQAPLVTPEPGASAQVAAAMLLYGLPRAARHGELAAWWRAFRGSREVSWDAADPAPFWIQPLSIASMARRALAVGEGLLDATTWDIRWDGEGE